MVSGTALSGRVHDGRCIKHSFMGASDGGAQDGRKVGTRYQLQCAVVPCFVCLKMKATMVAQRMMLMCEKRTSRSDPLYTKRGSLNGPDGDIDQLM
jgi:hypothetical protein